MYTLTYFNASVRARLQRWPHGLKARYLALTLRMQVHGPNLGMPHTRPMGAGLFEVRAKSIDVIGRAFFCALSGRRIVILHEFIKKSEKTPAREIRLARTRMKEITP